MATGRSPGKSVRLARLDGTLQDDLETATAGATRGGLVRGRPRRGLDADGSPRCHRRWGHRHYRSLSRRDAATRIRSGNMLHLDELVQRWSPRWVVPASETAPAKQCLAAPGSLEAALGYYRAAKSVGPTSAQRSKVSVPSVAFCGSDSTPLAAFEQARRCYQGSYEVVRVAGGHFMHRESPEEFTRELIRLLGDHVA
jgi:pimeloyl-ACP methyl ester carboxylesterase